MSSVEKLEKRRQLSITMFFKTELQDTMEEIVRTKLKAKKYLDIEDFADWIRLYITRGDIFSLLIQGLSGHGKTTLALKIAAAYFRKYWRRKTGYETALRFLMFDPLEVLSEIISHLRRDKILELIIFDDAGAWLSKWGMTADKRMFNEFINLLRTSVGAIIYTDIWSVTKYVRDTSKFRIIVEKLPRSLYEYYGIPRNSKYEWSLGTVYLTKLGIKGVYEKRVGEIIFPLDLPPKIRSLYKKKRSEYTMELAGRVMLRIIGNKTLVEKYKETRGGRKFLEEIYYLLGEVLE